MIDRLKTWATKARQTVEPRLIAVRQAVEPRIRAAAKEVRHAIGLHTGAELHAACQAVHDSMDDTAQAEIDRLSVENAALRELAVRESRLTRRRQRKAEKEVPE